MQIVKPNLMPTCYFPSTAYFIDDDVVYLDQIKARFFGQLLIKVESDPKVALNFLNDNYHQNAYWSRCFTKEKPVLGKPDKLILDVSVVTNEIYNPKRFEELTNIIVDYAMPGITGLDLAKQAKRTDSLIDPAISLSFLTGKMESPQRILEYIDAFYKKNDSTEKLFERLLKNQLVFFEDASLGIMHHLVNDLTNKTVCLIDPIFIGFMKKLISDKEITEYYIVDKQASYLMLDKKANLSWFLVRNELGMKQSIEWATQHDAPRGVIHALERFEKLLYVPDEKLFEKNHADWNDYLHPSQVLEGYTKYYTAYVTDLKHHNIDKKKILSYEEYLASH